VRGILSHACHTWPVLRAIFAFVAVAGGLAAALALAVALGGGPHGTLGGLALATMLIPAAAAWLLRATMGEAPRIDWSRLPIAYLPVALLLIPGAMHLAMLPAMRAAAGGLPWSGDIAVAAVARNAVVGLAVVSALALFEEIGWRGWLLPRLVERLPIATAVLVSSTVWAAWHVPFIVSGILVPDGVSTAQALSIVPLGVFGAGLVLGWLWLRTRSIWIVALAHGAMNNWGQFAFKYMQAGPGVDLAPVLLAGSVAVVVTGAVLVATLRRVPERITACAALVLLFWQPAPPPPDYTQWRGADRGGSASGFVVPRAWPDALTLAWRTEVGEGYSTPLVAGPLVYTFTRRDGDEVLTALEAASGAVRWRSSYAAPYTVNDAAARHGPGPKATPLLHRGRIFTMGISGIVTAFDAATGARLWQTPPPKEAAIFGAASSPLAEGDLVILHPGNYAPLTAFDAATGTVKWTAGDDGLFASPLGVTLDGVRQIVTVTQKAIAGVSLDGRVLWTYAFPNNGAGTPVLFQDTIVVGGLDLGFVAIRPRRNGAAWTADRVWETKAASTYFGTPVVVGGAVYGLSDKASGQFFALDASTGATLWLGPPRQAAYASIVKSGDLLFALKDNAELIVAPADRASFRPLKTYTVATSATWAQPVIIGSRIFVKDATTLTLWSLPR
jgi:outer membrane protein assembly factor BamB